MKTVSSPFELIKKSVNIFSKKENFVFLVKIYLPVVFFSLLSAAQSFLPASIKNSTSIWLVLGVGTTQILYFLTSTLVTVSAIIALGRVIGGGELSFKKTYKSAWENYWLFLLLSAVLTLIYVFGFLLLIVPGLIFVVWFAFSRFLVIERGLKIKQALLKSKEMVKGIYWKILGRLIIFSVFTVLIQMVLSIIPYNFGTVVSSLFGGLYMLPLYLLYKELNA